MPKTHPKPKRPVGTEVEDQVKHENKASSSMRTIKPVHLALILSLIVLAMVARLFFSESKENNQGHMIYSLDDAYIHMSLAKNLVTNGIWGVTPYEFSSASSSPLWTLLLAGVYKLAGTNEITPLILNLLLAILAIVLIWHGFKLYHRPVSPWYQFILLCLVILSVPLVPLASMGMEQTLYLVFTLVFTGMVVLNLTRDDIRLVDKQWMGISAITVLLVMARYEGLFLIGVCALLYLFRKRWSQGVLLVLFGLLPVVVFGLLSIKHGGLFLPNSILIKGSMPFKNLPPLMIPMRALMQLLNSPGMPFLYAAALVLFVFQRIQRKSIWQYHQTLPLIFIMITTVHALRATISTHYRYETYLIALGIIALGLGLRDFVIPAKGSSSKPVVRGSFGILAMRVVVVIISAAALVGLLTRAKVVHERILTGTTNIYEQQYQMAKFLQKYFPNESVVANDIGAITYFSDIHLLDLGGLANTEMTKVILDGRFGPEEVRKACRERKVRIAIVYERFFPGGLPQEWSPVGRWAIQNNTVCGDAVVTFFAVDPKVRPELLKALTEYNANLPSTVLYEVYQ